MPATQNRIRYVGDGWIGRAVALVNAIQAGSLRFLTTNFKIEGFFGSFHYILYPTQFSTDIIVHIDSTIRQLPTQVLEDHLTLSQPEGADCTPHITKYLQVNNHEIVINFFHISHNLT